MLTISENGIITVSRGDSFSFHIFINQGTALAPIRYSLQGTDKVILGVHLPTYYEFTDSQEELIQKTLTVSNLNSDGDIEVNFDATETSFMQPGDYYYSVKLYITLNSVDYINTIIPETKFVVIK